KQISHKYGINANEIWYKPHPRLTYDDYKIKREKLHCSAYNYENNSIAEVELLNENLKALYSMNSTTIYYSKKIFDVESYLIDVRSEDCHPASYKKAYYLANKLNIKAIHS
ncbi:alpha-2,8-polysialyltransferase family protein, partial [Candidatus Thioglobus sp.]